MRRLLFVALVAASAVQAYATWLAIRSDSRFIAARRLDDEGSYLDALEHVEVAAMARPGDARLRAWVGDIAQHASENLGTAVPELAKSLLDRAWAGYGGAVSIAPVEAWSWSGLAEIALRRAQLEDQVSGVSLEAVEEHSRGVLDPWRLVAFGAADLAVSLKPSGYQELDVLAAVLEASGEVDRAAETYVRSARLMPAPSFHVWGTGRRFMDSIYARLRGALLSGIEASPPYDRSLLHLEVSRFALAQGDADTAIAEARLSESSARNTYERHQSAMALGTALAASDPNGALQAWRRASKTGYDPAVVALNLAALERSTGQDHEACAHYGDALREFSADGALRVQASATCERAGEIETAETMLLDGLAVPGRSIPVAEALVAFLERQRRFHIARTLIGRWIEDDPSHPEFRRWLQEVSDKEIAAPTAGSTAR